MGFWSRSSTQSASTSASNRAASKPGPLTHRATWYGSLSIIRSAPYSCKRRYCRTSSCSAPTAPTIGSRMPPPRARRIWMAPSWVSGVHVRLDLEDESGEARLHGIDRRAVDASPRAGCGSQAHERVEELVHADFGHRRPEERRRQLAAQHLGVIEGVARRLQELDL